MKIRVGWSKHSEGSQIWDVYLNEEERIGYITINDNYYFIIPKKRYVLMDSIPRATSNFREPDSLDKKCISIAEAYIKYYKLSLEGNSITYVGKIEPQEKNIRLIGRNITYNYF